LKEDFNAIVATGRRREGQCSDELRYVGDLLGIRVLNTWFTGFDGLITARVDGDPVEFSNKLRDLVSTAYYIPRFILKFTPIFAVVNTGLEEIAAVASELGMRFIREDETYRVDVRKRGVDLDRNELIDAVASRIKRKVRLENPHKVVHIDIFPSRTGISVIREDDVFSLMRMTINPNRGQPTPS